MYSQELQDIIDSSTISTIQSQIDTIREELEEQKISSSYDHWDVKKEDRIEYFDPTLSYELTGYRPIDETRGLDFNPEWFIGARKFKEKHGQYCPWKAGKKFVDFWKEEYYRCNHGYTSHGYRITGDNYFFLNYYRLKNVEVEYAGAGRELGFPSFFSKQYEYFHYIELCRKTNHDVCALKARGVGFSEIAASLGIRLYSTVQGSRIAYTASADRFLTDVLSKCWEQMDFLNMDTEGGLRHRRMAINNDMCKRASSLNKDREEYGWMSQIQGVVSDKPSKLRGMRVDLLLFEESGSHPSLIKTYLQSTALVEILGHKFGTRLVWGTGKYLDI